MADKIDTDRPSYEELEAMVRELEDDAARDAEDFLDLQRRLDEARHERNVLRDQLTTLYTRPRPRIGWLCTCSHDAVHDEDGTCQERDCPCPESLVEIRDARDAALRTLAEEAPRG